MRYNVNLTPAAYWSGVENVEVVFHTINKSGSMAMENVMHEAFNAHDRSDEMMSHYKIGGPSAAFIDDVNQKKSRFVVGHYLFNALKPRVERIWVTQFRHPLPKILSAHNWLKRKHVRTNSGPFPGIEEFVVKGKGKAHSLVSQFGAGWGRYRASHLKRMTAQDLFEISIDTLEGQIHTIGLAEKFEETIFIFAHLCGLPSVAPWIRDNRNPGRPLAHEISDHEREIIEEVYKFDFELYRYAVARFDRQLSEIKFDGQIDLYKDACSDQYKDRITIDAGTH